MTRLDPRARRRVGLVAAVAGAVCALVVLIPIAESGGLAAASWLRLGFRPACHQITDRCLDLGAGPLPVCARCAGLYAGGLLGLLLPSAIGRRIRLRFRWLMVAAAPSVVDFALGAAGLPSLANWPRFWLALAPGLVAGLLLADAVAEISARARDAGNGRGIT